MALLSVASPSTLIAAMRLFESLSLVVTTMAARATSNASRTALSVSSVNAFSTSGNNSGEGSLTILPAARMRREGSSALS